jgi:hypothetical protein
MSRNAVVRICVDASDAATAAEAVATGVYILNLD